MNKAFIIGNGTSRKWFNLENLRGKGVIYGCNALYRSFEPDVLIAIDSGMIAEIEFALATCDHHNFKFIVPPEEERWEPIEVNPNRPRSNAGMNAMIEAIRDGATELYCFGFDFLLLDADSSVSNLYDGTDNYGPTTRASYYDNPGRMNYLFWLIRKHPEVNFTFVYPTKNANKPNLPNANIISYLELVDIIEHG